MSKITKHTYKSSGSFCSPVMYVKLPTYVKQWLYSIYGEPASIPRELSLYEIMLAHLRPVDLTRRSKLSCCSQAIFENTDIMDMTDSDRDAYSAIRLPNEVTINGVRHRTSEMWQLTDNGSKDFRRDAANQFWRDIDNFVSREIAKCNARMERVYLEDIVDDFLQTRKVSLSCSETVRRQYRRRKLRLIKDKS